MRRQKIYFFAFASMGATLLCAPQAQAQVIIPTSADLGTTNTVGTGLTGLYYGNNLYVGNTANAVSYTQTHSAQASFVSTTIDYPHSGQSLLDTSTLNDFLGSDSQTLSKSSVGNNLLNGQLMEFKGYINIATAGNITFNLGSDDGAQMQIGGVTVDNQPGDRSFAFTSGTANFASAGLYAIDIVYYETNGFTGVELTSNMGGQTGFISTSSLYQSNFQPTPEPGPMAMAAGLCALGSCALFRRRAARRS